MPASNAAERLGLTAAVPASTASRRSPLAPRRSFPLWFWVLVAFGVQLAAWTVWFVIASHHRVAEVPLSTAPAK